MEEHKTHNFSSNSVERIIIQKLEMALLKKCKLLIMENNKEYEIICFKDRLYKKLKKYLLETSPPYLSINKILNLMKQVYVNENQLLEHLQLGINLPDFNNNIEEVITNLENLQLIKDLLNFVDIDIITACIQWLPLQDSGV